jgi:hypothetical protein
MKKRLVKKLDVIAQNQNHFRNQGVEIVQKLSILCKHRNQCRLVLSKAIVYVHTIIPEFTIYKKKTIHEEYAFVDGYCMKAF